MLSLHRPVEKFVDDNSSNWGDGKDGEFAKAGRGYYSLEAGIRCLRVGHIFTPAAPTPPSEAAADLCLLPQPESYSYSLPPLLSATANCQRNGQVKFNGSLAEPSAVARSLILSITLPFTHFEPCFSLTTHDTCKSRLVHPLLP